MSRPRLPNNITPHDLPGYHTLTVLTAQVNWEPVVEYVFRSEQLEIVEQHHWYAGTQGRAASHTGGKDRDTVYLARLLVGAQRGQRVVMVNGDVTDLRLENIQICKPAARTLAKRARLAARHEKNLDTRPPLV